MPGVVNAPPAGAVPPYATFAATPYAAPTEPATQPIPQAGAETRTYSEYSSAGFGTPPTSPAGTGPAPGSLTYTRSATRRHPYGWLAVAAVTAIVVAAGFLAASTLRSDDTVTGPAAPATQVAAPADPTQPAQPAQPAPTGLTPAEPAPAVPAPITTTVPPAEPLTEAEPGQEPPPVTRLDRVGMVTIDNGLTDPRAQDVAAMLDTYFTGINAHDMDLVASVLDPSGVVDPASPREMQALADDTSTTRDDDVTLWSLTGKGSTLRAHVTFRSRQQAGMGPRSDPGQTCTRWELDYTLRARSDGYRIVRSSGPPSAC